MRVRVLGSAAGGGLPQWNCGGPNSRRARAGDPDVPPRSQPAIAVGSGDGRWSVVNASPDVREQWTRFPGLHPRPGTRDVPVDRIALTNADLDHVLGLLVLREALPYRVVTTNWIARALLDHNAAFRLLEAAFQTAEIGAPFALDRGENLEAQFFPLPGKVPTWLSGLCEDSPEATLGLRITDRRSGRRIVYAPGLSRLDDAVLAELSQAELRFVDGTFWSDGELLELRPDAPNARRMGHLPIGGAEGSLAALRELPGRSFYIHINNTNPILDARSPEATAVREAGIEIAMDGMEIAL